MLVVCGCWFICGLNRRCDGVGCYSVARGSKREIRRRERDVENERLRDVIERDERRWERKRPRERDGSVDDVVVESKKREQRRCGVVLSMQRGDSREEEEERVEEVGSCSCGCYRRRGKQSCVE